MDDEIIDSGIGEDLDNTPEDTSSEDKPLSLSEALEQAAADIPDDGEEAPSEAQEGEDKPEEAPPTPEEEKALPEDVRNYISELEVEKTIAEQFKASLEPHFSFIQEIGVNPYEHVEQLLGLSEALHKGSPEVKAQVLANLFESFGVDVNLLDDALSAVMNKPQPTATDILMQKMDNLERKISQPQRAPEPQSIPEPTADMVAQVQEFAAKNPYFERVQSDMGLLLQAGRASSLEDAYAKAVKLNDEIQAEIRQKATKTAGAAKAGTAQLKSSGSPSRSASNTKSLSLREALERAMES
jgi:hypothetical protein